MPETRFLITLRDGLIPWGSILFPRLASLGDTCLYSVLRLQETDYSGNRYGQTKLLKYYYHRVPLELVQGMAIHMVQDSWVIFPIED